MPLYEYACEKCGKVFEVMQKFVDEPVKVHEECGGKVDRLISAPALHFKGSGFYITDYAKGNGNSNAPGRSAGTPEVAKSEGSKGEGSKSEGKSEGSKSDSKSEGSKSEGSKSESSKPKESKSSSSSDSGSSSSSSSSTPAPATPSKS